MHYKNKKVAVTGHDGFLGSLLCSRLEELGAIVYRLEGDTRDMMTFLPINHTFSYLFHFGSPSSQVVFKRQGQYAVDVTVNGFLNASRVCQRTGVKLVYPSTGLLSQGKYNEYAMCKKICEDIAPGDSLGLRIFATYGPNEIGKRDYASTPYLFMRDAQNGKKPVLFGDGKQIRDFIYQDDAIEAILTLADECNDKIVDVGSGQGVSFNQIVKLLGVKPTYIPAPDNYVKETISNPKVMLKYYKPKVSFEEGMKRLCEPLLSPLRFTFQSHS